MAERACTREDFLCGDALDLPLFPFLKTSLGLLKPERLALLGGKLFFLFYKTAEQPTRKLGPLPMIELQRGSQEFLVRHNKMIALFGCSLTG
jgi:hypothetical protein